MGWFNNKEVDKWKEKRVENRREMDDMHRRIDKVDGVIKECGDKKQNKLHFGWLFGLIMMILSQTGALIWWISAMDATKQHMSLQLIEISDSLKDATRSRFTSKDAMIQFGMRDDSIKRLTAAIQAVAATQKDTNDRMEDLERTVTSLYSNKRK